MFNVCRRDYLRVSGPGPNRLQVASTLAGLTSAGFVALLSGKPIPSNIWPHLNEGLLLMSGLFLGIATIFFLIAALSTYEALRLIAILDPGVVDKLKNNTPEQIDLNDVERLRQSYRWYLGGSGLTTNGLMCLLAALCVIGLYVNLELGVLIGISALAVTQWRTGYPLQWVRWRVGRTRLPLS